MDLTSAVTFAAVFPALFTAHQVMDHWGQSDHQARCKGTAGWAGRRACASHVAAYTAGSTVAVVAVVLLLGLPVSALGIALGQVVSAVTHYWADRRTTLAGLASRVGKGPFYRLGSPRSGLHLRRTTGDGTPTGEPADLILVDAAGTPVTWDNPHIGTGAYALDQSFHYCWLLVAALITALV